MLCVILYYILYYFVLNAIDRLQITIISGKYIYSEYY